MAQTNMYLKLDGLDGESLDEDHKNWIEIESFHWGVDNPSSFAQGQGGQSTQAHIASMDIVKRCDKSSVILKKNCTTGKHIASGTVSCMKLDGDSRVEYLKIDLTDIMVSNFQWTGSGGDVQMGESVSLVFAEYKSSFKLQQNTGGGGGSVEHSYNVQTGKST
jgi:type VI secretion system secreted protein Hcp